MWQILATIHLLDKKLQISQTGRIAYLESVNGRTLNLPTTPLQIITDPNERQKLVEHEFCDNDPNLCKHAVNKTALPECKCVYVEDLPVFGSTTRMVLSTYVPTALTPDPVQNLTAVIDPHKPSVTLNWDPPANAGYMEVTKYHICFWDKAQNQNHYREKIARGFTLNPSVVITRDSGIRALTYSTFEVRAYSGDDVSQECKTISTFIGMYVPSVHYLPIRCPL